MPPQIKNLKKVAQRLKEAIRLKERIILFGDSDPDGIGSVVILKEAISSAGWKIDKILFSDRYSSAPGLTLKVLERVKPDRPALFILLDCGISNFQEIEKAQELGFEVIVIDHHEPGFELPKASLIINPKQPGDKYPFKMLATAGLVLKLAKELLGKKISPGLLQSFKEIAALATISDMMPQEADNLFIIQEGIMSLKDTLRPGLRALIKTAGLQEIQDPWQLASKLSALLGAGNFIDDFTHETYLLLIEDQEDKAIQLAQKLCHNYQNKKETIEKITKEVLEKIKNAYESLEIVFEGSPDWKLNFLGPVASNILKELEKPVFLYQQGKEITRGSIRVPCEYNAILALEHCKNFLEVFGGHPQAAGFTIATKNLESFKNCLIQYFKSQKK